MTYLWVGIGGMAGSALRYLFAFFGEGAAWPAGTLLANAAGCFLLGLLSSASARTSFPEPVHKALSTGVIGSFTTFSAFSAEVAELAAEGRIGAAFLYFAGSAAAGLLFTAAGLKAGGRIRTKGAVE